MIAVSVVLFLPIINVSYTGFPGTTADRFLYLPLLPFAIAVGAKSGAHRIARWAKRPTRSHRRRGNSDRLLGSKLGS